jgi:hypothetical protein
MLKYLKGFSWALTYFTLGGLLFSSGCTYVTPEAENPTPGLELASTTHIVQNGILSLKKEVIGIEIDQESNTWTNKRKTWLCGWAPITQSGAWHGAGGLNASPLRSRHCNMEFRISRDGSNLEARTINLNYPNDYERWPLLFTIPIQLHYFYERDVDARGRELNRFRKVSERKNWQLSPIMDLDLRQIQFHDVTRRPSDHWLWGGRLTDVYDIEIEVGDKNFIGFNGTHVHGLYGSHIQHVYRFNFLELKDNPDFKITPYDSRNARHMNILHILGNQPDGLHEVNYAAHWDVSKPVEFCLNGFPEDSRNYRQIGMDVIEEMNKTMEKIGAVPAGQKAFVVSEREMKYDFDLRCPSITWIDDPILSFRAPLGIGLVNTNIKTGEILWGNAVVWGGLIDYIVNRDSESVADALARHTHEQMRSIELMKHNPYFRDFSEQYRPERWSAGQNFRSLESFTNQSRPNFNLRDLLQNHLPTSAQTGVDESSSIEPFVGQLRQILDSTGYQQLDRQGLLSFSTTDSDLAFNMTYQPSDRQSFLQDVNQASGLAASVQYNEAEQQLLQMVRSGQLNGEEINRYAQQHIHRDDLAIDHDNFVENYYYSWSAASASLAGLERLDAARSIIKNVTLHELGHVVGLGHQFEGGRMPDKGTVPDSVYQQLAQDQYSYHNSTSIMDYPSGYTQITLPYEKVKMGAQDELTLNYLYRQKYSTYKGGDSNFTYLDVPANGVIPNQTQLNGQTYVTRYMPQCSDVEAWLATSPYCRRWSRGYDAPSSVTESLNEYTDTFITRMNSFTEASGGNPFWTNYRLWSSTYDLMNTNRTFYDNLRYQLAANNTYRRVFDRIKTNRNALMAFSRACIDPSQAPSQNWKLDYAKLALLPIPTGADLLAEDRQRRLSDADYRGLLNRYERVLGNRNTLDLDDDGFRQLEQDLHSQGLAYTELQKLCRATKKTLDVAKLLLSLKGPDHPVMNYNNAIVPTGLRGGQATSDYSRMFGTYNQLGILPIKLAALDMLTSTSSTLRFWWWNVPKPQYNDPNEGKYGYFALYPEEFTDIVSTAVKNNMGFGGTQLQDAASMSIANLYMNFYLMRSFYLSNDTQVRGFNANYIEDLRAQSQFQVNFAPILLESISIPGEPTNRRFGFRPKLFNLANRELIELPEAYALPGRKVIIRGNESQILLPLTKMRFLGQGAAFVWALEVTYDKTAFDDPLQGFTVKNTISELTNQELDKCMTGSTGLATFFNSNEEFQGFQIDPSIATDTDAQTSFERSLNQAFDVYHNREGLTPQQIACEESLKGVGLITSTALSLNGFILPQVFEYIRK